MIIGPYINALAIISGAVIGSVLGGRIPERLRTNLTLIFGLCSMGMGIVMVAKTTNMPAMILSVLLGTIIGELLLLEHGINKPPHQLKALLKGCSLIHQVACITKKSFCLNLLRLWFYFHLVEREFSGR